MLLAALKFKKITSTLSQHCMAISCVPSKSMIQCISKITFICTTVSVRHERKGQLRFDQLYLQHSSLKNLIQWGNQWIMHLCLFSTNPPTNTSTPKCWKAFTVKQTAKIFLSFLSYNFFFAATVKKFWHELIQFISLWNKNKYDKILERNQFIE